MAEWGDKELASRVASRSARLRNELQTLEQIQRHLEREIEGLKKQGETGDGSMLRQALGRIMEKIEKVRAKLNLLEKE